MAVSKTKPWDSVEKFYSLGVRDFGENYVQEALAKREIAAKLGIKDIRWHLIGTLQSNKAKFIPGNFHIFQALDSESLLLKLDKAAAQAGLVQECFLEVNVDLETTKGGISEAHVPKFIELTKPLKNILLTGLMCIPAPSASRDPRVPFQKLRELREKLNQSGAYHSKLHSLSMGMSSDFEAAIEEGATHVRVGTTLFGARGSQ